MTTPVSIYTYTDYRRYLKDFYAWKKERFPGFSYRAFSRKAEVAAPNFLPWLIQGARNLAPATIPRVCKALGISAQEREYFHHLVLFNQARTINEKTVHFLALARLRKPFKVPLVTEIQFEHYRHWYNEAIRELLRFYPFVPTEKYAFRKLARMLAPEIDETMARRAVKLLLRLGLIAKTGDGSLRQTDAFITTGDDVAGFLVKTFHHAMITLANESLDRFPKERRDISSLTVSISDACGDLIKQEIRLFRKRILEMVRMDKDPNAVYQINFQFFPLTRDSRGARHDEE
jgi:uncharacterized protein (TIGR02147 family)